MKKKRDAVMVRTGAADMPEPTNQQAVSLHGISKSYGPVRALSQMSLVLEPGVVHALVGENGSGKSTLAGVISGTVTPDEGELVIEGRTVEGHSPLRALEAGIVTVYQDGSLLPDLTVAQNLYIGTAASQRPPYRQLSEWAHARLATLGPGRVDVDARTSTISAGDRQIIEIARAVLQRPRVLILDESTSALDAGRVDDALAMMRAVADDGVAVLFVTHRLSEVFRVADVVSVLRDGVHQGTFLARDTHQLRLVELMAGTSVDLEFPPRSVSNSGETLLELVDDADGEVMLSVRSGEILGIAGAAGNGQEELLRALVGGSPLPSAHAVVNGRVLSRRRQFIRAGVSFVSADRGNESLAGKLSVRENLTLAALGTFGRFGVIRGHRERRFVGEQVERFSVRLGRPDDPVSSLSGGNQQKVALARAMSVHPRLLVIDEPTQGVDVRSRLEIYRMLRSAADQGMGVVVCSSDASELAGIADRIAVLSRGNIISEIPGVGSTEEQIVEAFAVTSELDERSRATVAEEVGAPKARGLRRAIGRLDFPATRLMALALAIIGIGIYVQSQTGTFFTEQFLYNVGLLAIPVVVASIAQFTVLLVGGIDLSMGGAIGLGVVITSFVATTGPPALLILKAALAVTCVCLCLGFANVVLVHGLGVLPAVATIATLYIAVGINYALRPTPDGFISFEVQDMMLRAVSFLPYTLLAVIVIAILADAYLWFTGAGLRVRATGLNPAFAQRTGVRVRLIQACAYLACAVAGGITGLLVAGQVGVGDASIGINYILFSVAGAVIGGATLTGGRGSFLGCVLGGLVIALSIAVVPALQLSVGWSSVVTGAITLIALVSYETGTLSSRASVSLRRWDKERGVGKAPA